ncbi:hypothetical protein ABZ485_05835 [Streptomyces albogriseolus]|uniref:hypothetical protein n=1 Tax=Streptomyces albogriseolus TaxID=1887 RepID=UPI0034601292
MAAVIENPIINSPYAEPAWHWELDERGQPTGERVPGRHLGRVFTTLVCHPM